MSYRLKGGKVLIEGDLNKIVPQVLPSSPEHGQFCIDILDSKYKVWNESLNRWIILGDAEDQVFDNSTNGFVAEDTQSAIEEVKNSSVSSLIQFEYWNNGTSSNTWLNTAGSPLPSNTVPRIVPVKSKLVGVTFTNANDGVDLDIRVNIAKVNQALTLDRTIVYEVRNMRTYRSFNFNEDNEDLILDPGDKVSVYINDVGGNPNDPVTTLYLKTLEEDSTTTSENFSSSFSITLGPITIFLG